MSDFEFMEHSASSRLIWQKKIEEIGSRVEYMVTYLMRLGTHAWAHLSLSPSMCAVEASRGLYS